LDFLASGVSSTAWTATININSPQTDILVAQAALYLYTWMSIPNFDSGTTERFQQMMGFWQGELQTNQEVQDAQFANNYTESGLMLLPKRKRGFPVVDFSQIPPASIITEYIKDSAITVNEIAANAITATKILAGTITADRLDAAVLVAGNILISGTIYLSDWAHSSDSEKLDGAVVYTGSIDKTGLNFVAFEKDVDTLDGMAEGSTYNRVLSTHISAGKIKLLSTTVVDAGFTIDKVGDGATYERVLATDITAGHILLSSVTQSSSYRTVTDANKTTWNGKPDNMDEIGDGATYKKVRATQISAGYIKLTSQTVKTSEWYDESGVEIDATHGINIYGVNNA
ncbi:hypothetical protein LCGC14_3123460, partial [marine sediment metagenome]